MYEYVFDWAVLHSRHCVLHSQIGIADRGNVVAVYVHKHVLCMVHWEMSQTAAADACPTLIRYCRIHTLQKHAMLCALYSHVSGHVALHPSPQYCILQGNTC